MTPLWYIPASGWHKKRMAALIKKVCYTTVFSTTSVEDFSKVRSACMEISTLKCAADEFLSRHLSYPGRWVLVSRFGGCSCHFRHDMNDLGFGPAEEWMQEDPEDVEATRHVYDLFQRILREGFGLDVLDYWEGDKEDFRSFHVDLAEVPRDHFRFQSGTHMVLHLAL